jgi:hypothetical protein
VTAWGLQGGGGWWGWPEGVAATTAAAGDAGGFDGASRAEAPALPATGPDTSTTNTQEAGVDEGDLVETDGRYLWTVADGTLRVVDVIDGRQVTTAELPPGGHQLLLEGDRLAVITSSWGEVSPLAAQRGGLIMPGTSEAVVSLFDVGDRARLSLLGRTYFEGDVVAARASDGTVRLVLRTGFGTRLPFVQPTSPSAEEKAEQLNREVIEEAPVEDWLPRRYTETPSGDVTDPRPALDCTEVDRPAEFSGLGILWVAELPFASPGTAEGVAGVVAEGETAYASATSLYVATTRWPWGDALPGDVIPVQDSAPTTQIHRFALGGDAGTRYVSTGEVPGVVLNQFSMSEWDGVLRVALTEQDQRFGTTSDSESAVRVLREDGDRMVEIGAVTGLGRTEQIYAVRFIGDRGYVVTFRQTDPLYVIDLADPAAPRLTGELKIPGFSSYLHPIAPGRLIGIGQDADLDGRVKGAQLSVFDVSDPATPRQVATMDIGGWSDAQWDHHAFLWWPAAGEAGASGAEGTVVVPTQQWDGPSFMGAVIAGLDGDTLGERGRIEHPDTQGWGPIQRSLIVDGKLVTVSPAGVMVSDLGSLGQVHWIPTR